MTVPESPSPGNPFLQHPRVAQLRRSLRFVWFFMLFSMAFVCFVVYHSLSAPLSLDPATFGSAAVALALASVLLPDWLAQKINSGKAQDPLGTLIASLILDFILRFMMTETALILLMLVYHKDAPMALAMYGAACGLMLFHYPSDTRILQIASR